MGKLGPAVSGKPGAAGRPAADHFRGVAPELTAQFSLDSGARISPNQYDKECSLDPSTLPFQPDIGGIGMSGHNPGSAGSIGLPESRQRRVKNCRPITDRLAHHGARVFEGPRQRPQTSPRAELRALWSVSAVDELNPSKSGGPGAFPSLSSRAVDCSPSLMRLEYGIRRGGEVTGRYHHFAEPPTNPEFRRALDP